MDWEEERLLYRVAKLYYHQDYTQAQISKELGIYRTTIGRMLKKARKEGIVTIQIQSNSTELFNIENEIMEHFDMKEVIIVPSFENQSNEDLLQGIGEACSSLFNRILKDGDIVGLNWGRSLGNMVHRLYDLKSKDVECVPLVGGPGGMDTDYHVNAITMRMSNALHGKPHLINAAAVYQSEETTQEVLESNFMEEILNLWEKTTVAIVGIGAPSSSSNMVWSGFLGESEQDNLKMEQAIGDVCSRFFTIDGEVINNSISKRTIAISLEKLKDLRYSVGVAYSKEKVEAIIGAMKGKFINTLVTNEETALEIYRVINKK